MAKRPRKTAPVRPMIQWRWVMTKEVREKTLWHEDFKATMPAIVHAKDHYVTLNYVTATGKNGMISKTDVQDYIDAGKPEVETGEARYPKLEEIFFEVCKALMHVTQQMMWDAVPLYVYMQFEEIKGERTPVIVIEWGIRRRRAHAGNLRRRDNRFGIIAARPDHPWGNSWGARD